MLYRCPYEGGHVYVCSKVGWLAHPVPGHGKKSGYTPAYYGPPLCSIHLCSPRKVSIARDGFHLLRKLSVVATLITKVLFEWLLIRAAE